MFDLTERERRISDVIIEWSFGRGKEDATIHELDAFVDLTGIAREDVSRTLKLLMARRIVQRRGPRASRTYAFLPFAAYWQETRPLFDAERATMRAAELDRINTQMRLVSRDGDPVEEADLDDGMAAVSRDEALVEAQSESAVEPVRRLPDEVGKSPTTGGVGKLPICGSAHEGHAYAHAGDVLPNDKTVRNVLHNVVVGKSPTERAERSLRFADEEKNFIFAELEKSAGGPDFDRYRWKWIQRVRDFPGVVREAIGDVKMFRANPHNKLRKPAGALIFHRCKEIAKAAGKEFRLW